MILQSVKQNNNVLKIEQTMGQVQTDQIALCFKRSIKRWSEKYWFLF